MFVGEREIEAEGGRESGRVLVSSGRKGWLLPFKLLKGRVKANISAEAQTSDKRISLSFFRGRRKDSAMPAEVKEVGAWWNGSLCSVPSLFFRLSVLILLLRRTVCHSTPLHSASVMMNEVGISRFTSAPLTAVRRSLLVCMGT